MSKTRGAVSKSFKPSTSAYGLRSSNKSGLFKPLNFTSPVFYIYSSKYDLVDVQKSLSTFKFIDVCLSQPLLIRLSFGTNDAANQVFVDSKGSLQPITEEEWKKSNYKWSCVDKYYLESTPDEILLKLPVSDLLSKTKINASDWKTYTNHDLGIEFKYPADWEKDKNGYMGVFGKDAGTLWISKDNSERHGDWAIDKLETIPNSLFKYIVSSSKQQVINNNTGAKLYGFDYAIKIGNKIYLEYYFRVDSANGERDLQKENYYQEIFATILSTFKFVN